MNKLTTITNRSFRNDIQAALAALGLTCEEEGSDKLLVLNMTDAAFNAIKPFPSVTMKTVHVPITPTKTPKETTVTKPMNKKQLRLANRAARAAKIAEQDAAPTPDKDEATVVNAPPLIGGKVKLSEEQLKKAAKRDRQLKKEGAAGAPVPLPASQKTPKADKPVKAPKSPKERRVGNIPLMASLLVAGKTEAEQEAVFTTRYAGTSHRGAPVDAAWVKGRVDIYRTIALKDPVTAAAVEALKAKAPKAKKAKVKPTAAVTAPK